LDAQTTPAIVVVGSTMIDLVAYADRLPDTGETVVGNRFDLGFGGKGANQSVMARLLGADVWMVNSVGTDSYGDMTLENFAKYGVDTAHVLRAEGSSGVAPIWVEPDGSNRIIIIPGANHAMTVTQAANAVAAIDATVVVGQLEIPQDVTRAGFATARARGAVTVLNPAPAAALELGLLAETDWLIPNEVEFAMLTGRPATDDGALIEFAAETGTRLVVTLGEEGVALVTGDGRVEHVAAPKVDAADTTGAGDAFVGAFAYGLAAGLGDAVAVRLGIRCASDSVTRLGTQSSFPDPDASAAILAAVITAG
jgi:ribokinase